MSSVLDACSERVGEHDKSSPHTFLLSRLDAE